MKEKQTEKKEISFGGNRRRSRVADLVQIALMSAVFCILAPIAMPVPFSPVPITFGTFVLYVTAVIAGGKKGIASVALYLLIGLAGLPVFSGFTTGFTKLMGPGGGYMIGYLPAAYLIGRMAKKTIRHGNRGACLKQGIRMAGIFACGAVVCYLFGTVWFMMVMNYTLPQALLVCVVPFLPFELIKIILASGIALPVRRKLRRAGILGREEFL